MTSENCPFKVGDKVIYLPSTRGKGLVANTKLARLIPGQEYTVSRIDKDAYIVVKGFEDAAGDGLYWTEFRKAEPAT